MMETLPLVLIPGSLCDHELFAHQLRHMSVPTSVADVTTASSIPDMAAAVLDEAPPQFAVAGLSLGGIVAAEMLTQASDRILGLGLLDTNLGAPDATQIELRRRWASEVRAGHFARVVTQDLVRSLTVDASRHGDLIFDMAMRVGPAAFLRQNAALVERTDRRDVVRDLDIPLLVVSGAADQVTPRALHDDLVERSPHATQLVVPDAGHLSTIDQPATLTRVLSGWVQTCITNHQLQEGKENNEYNLA